MPIPLESWRVAATLSTALHALEHLPPGRACHHRARVRVSLQLLQEKVVGNDPTFAELEAENPSTCRALVAWLEEAQRLGVAL